MGDGPMTNLWGSRQGGSGHELLHLIHWQIRADFFFDFSDADMGRIFTSSTYMFTKPPPRRGSGVDKGGPCGEWLNGSFPSTKQWLPVRADTGN